jgi:hypothetical protein
MTPRNYDIETSDLIVLCGDDGNNSYKDVWAIFDVSPTVECRFIAIHWDKSHPNEKNQEREMLTTFDHIHELLLWCAYRQEVDGAAFRTGFNSDHKCSDRERGAEWLDKLCQAQGWESWDEYVEEYMDLFKKPEKSS